MPLLYFNSHCVNCINTSKIQVHGFALNIPAGFVIHWSVIVIVVTEVQIGALNALIKCIAVPVYIKNHYCQIAAAFVPCMCNLYC